MPATMIVEVPGGGKVLFGGRNRPSGMREISLAEDVATATAEGFKAALGTLANLVATLEDKVGHMPNRPDKVEMEFRASLSGECDLWIVSGDGEAEFKVTLTWGKES